MEADTSCEGRTAYKRKQARAVNDVALDDDQQELITVKKQCLNGDILNGHSGSPILLNGHGVTNGNHTHGHMPALKGGNNGGSEHMDCSDGDHTVEKTTSEVGHNVNLCPHGHANECTTYNVPCRYPRIYCHPAGLLEEHIATYGI